MHQEFLYIQKEPMETIQLICTIVSGVALPLLGVFLFYDAKKREAIAKASKAEADNITQYAAQWRELYEEKVKHEEELNEKIDSLYAQLNEQRDELSRLKKEMTELTVKFQFAESQKCTVYGCPNRQPPQIICASSHHPEQ